MVHVASPARWRRAPLGVAVATALAASPGGAAPPQSPNPLPRGLFTEEAPVFDPAADDVPPPDAAPEAGPLPPPSADPPPAERVRLIYAPGPWASVCPRADEVPALVRHHLGRDPFGEPATRVALIALDGDGLAPSRARVELLDLALEPVGSRVVDAGDGCGELVATAAFQLALALDPLAAAAGPTTAVAPGPPVDPAGPTAPPPPTEPPAVMDAPAAEPPPTPAPATPTTDRELFFVFGGHVAALLAPEGAMPGLSAGVGLRWAAVSARVEGRVDISGDDRGTTSVPILVTLQPCAHVPVVDFGREDGALEVSGCVTATAGIMPAIGVYTGFGLYAGSGARLALEWRLPGELTMRLFGQVEAAGLRPILVNLSSGNIYQSPAFNGLLGVGMDLPGL